MLALLDQIGVVVKHSDTTLLDPNWLTTAVYRVLTHAAVVKAGGEFAAEDLGRLLADLKSADKYPRKCWSYIADMMVRFNLSFGLPDQPGRYLVPLQLPTQLWSVVVLQVWVMVPQLAQVLTQALALAVAPVGQFP